MKNEDIISMLRNRSELAFEFIYKSYYSDMLNFADSYLMNRELARDFVHDVYHKIWEQSNEMPHILNIKSYLFTMIKNRCINHLKHLGVIDSNNDKLVEAIIFSNTYSYINDETIEKKVNECLEKLTTVQQLVMKMRYVDGMSYAAIATELDVSHETIHTHIQRAFKFFRENYKFLSFLVPII